MKQRIQQIMEREGMTPGRFADSIGIQRSALSHILNGRNNPSLDVLTKILNRFDYLSTDWLLFGNGPMFKHQCDDSSLVPDSFNSSDNSLFDENEDSNEQNIDVNTLNNTTVTSPSNPNNTTEVVKEMVLKEFPVSRTVQKIMIFYSDNTFENFVPETPGQIKKLK